MRRTIKANIWEYYENGFYIVIPTHGHVASNGENVIKVGLSKTAKLRFPSIPKILGHKIRTHGNSVFYLGNRIINFPERNNHWETGSLKLIERSAEQLMTLAEKMDLTEVALPKVGCGHGGLDWEDVKPLLEEHLDSRFVIVDRRG